MEQLQIPIPNKLLPLLKPKRFKVIIGGRGSAKSETTAALFAAMVHQSGCRAVCCREFQTSIKQSVHSLIKRKINDLDLDGFDVRESEIFHAKGGHILYQGLSRDPEAIKSIDDAELAWVEEAQTLSYESLQQLTPSIRGKESELWFTANLRSSKDPFSVKFIKPFERQLRKDGIYEDDLHTIVWINYQDNPWFPEVLEMERVRDKMTLSTAEYAHKWEGEFSDTVDSAIIKPDWFDSAIDAHVKLGFKPLGARIASHDPSDEGGDAKGYALRHGAVILDVQESLTGDVNEGCDWAIDLAINANADYFLWDCDGMGISLKRQVSQSLAGKKIEHVMFRGSESPDNPDDYSHGDSGDRRTNRQTFKNKRAQYYWRLRDRFYATFRAINGEYIDPDELISLSSDIKCLDQLRAEVCRIPKKPNGSGLIQIMTKLEMKSKYDIDSPNLADAMMQSMYVPDITEHMKLEFASGW